VTPSPGVSGTLIVPSSGRVTGAFLAGLIALILGLPGGIGSWLADSAQHAATPQSAMPDEPIETMTQLKADEPQATGEDAS